MSWEMVQLLSSGGAGAAVIVVTVIFLKYLKEERAGLMEDRRKERREFLDRLEGVANAIRELNSALGDRPCMLRRSDRD